MSDTSADEDIGFAALPGWLQGTILAVTGLTLLWTYLPTWQFVLLWMIPLGALAIFGYRQVDEHGSVGTALRELRTSWEKKKEEAERADPPTSYQTSKLKNAVGLRCEVPDCGTQRSLHVHHITPRSEGGGNELGNLIVVCRNHHADCENGSFNRTQQREMIRGDRFQDDSVKDYWRSSVD